MRVLVIFVLMAVLAGCGDMLPGGPAVPGDQPVSGSPGVVGEPGPSVRGTISGRVTGAGGAPVVGAVVQPRSLDSPPKAIPEMLVATDQTGSYGWSLQPGRYEITVVVSGDTAGSSRREATVQAGQVTTLDFTV